jgi:hypothetical protein
MQAIALPPPIVKRALKSPLPELDARERIRLSGKLYAQLALGATRRPAP